MIIRCDNCSVSLQLDESKIPSGNFSVRCPRCQNLLRVQKDAAGRGLSTVEQLTTNKKAEVAEGTNVTQFAEREHELQINNALRSLIGALQANKEVVAPEDEEELPRRVLLCLGEKKDEAAKALARAGYKVYVAQTPGQANERLRDGKTGIVVFSQDFAPEHGGAAILQQKANTMYSSERRRLYLISLDDKAVTMNAHEAFLRNLNLVVNTKDVAQLPLIIDRAVGDYNDLYSYLHRETGLQPL
jgi:predicted Zn finger-like uncharacterized protein